MSYRGWLIRYNYFREVWEAEKFGVTMCHKDQKALPRMIDERANVIPLYNVR